MAAPLAFLNGEFLPADRAAIALHDAGFVQGATVTDMVRTFGREPFRWEQHLARFRQSCTFCRVPLLHANTTITAWMRELLARNPGNDELGIVLFATPGPLGRYAGLPDNGPPTFGMHVFPLPLDRYRRLYDEGARLVIPSVRQVPPTCVDPRAKQRSRMHWWIAHAEARERDPLAESLLLDERGFVTETASANLLVVKNGVVSTPPAGTVLPGVTLDVVRVLCNSLQIEFREQPLTPDDCRAADEMMLTCTTWSLAGVSWFDGSPMAWPGPVFVRLAKAFADLVGRRM